MFSLLSTSIVGELFGGLPIYQEPDEWYVQLKRPKWRPSNWYFAPVWAAVHIYEGRAAAHCFIHHGQFAGCGGYALKLYATKLALEIGWGVTFNHYHKIKYAYYQLLVIDVFSVYTLFELFKLDALAGWYFTPSVIWLGLATALHYRIYKDNQSS